MITKILIALNLIIYFTLNYKVLESLGVSMPRDIDIILSLNFLCFERAYYWQIITSSFMHGGIAHLVLNMLVLWQFGSVLERYLGALRFGLLYFVGTAACGVLSGIWVYFDTLNSQIFVNLVGASGAICVLMGYYAVLDKRSAAGLVVAILLMSFVPIFMGLNIAWYAHIFGFICGYILAKIAKKTSKNFLK